VATKITFLSATVIINFSKVKWKWTTEYQDAIDKMKALIAKETLLTFPDISKEFEIHTDASKLQLGACISQNGKPVAFYLRKLQPAQTRYTTTEQELLSRTKN
jgi:RNase H-like domain found in reverse transcriptase